MVEWYNRKTNRFPVFPITTWIVDTRTRTREYTTTPLRLRHCIVQGQGLRFEHI
jgi:hypothetical protein